MRVLVLIAMLPLAACSQLSASDSPGLPGSGSGNERTYQAADFTKVSVSGADDVDIRTGAAFSVRAEGDPAILEQLKIEKDADGDELRIGRRHHAGFNWSRGHVKIFVTMPKLVRADTAGAGDLTIDRVSGGDFAGNSAGAGSITIGTIAVDHASFDIAGAGDVKVAGTAQSIKLSIAGAGDVTAKALVTNSADISIAGSGNVAMTVKGDARVSIMGSGDVDLGPAAKCNVSKMGSGSVRCGS